MRRPVNLQIDFHPVYLTKWPGDDLSEWFRVRFRNEIARWFLRKEIPFEGWWVRENYLGWRREHIHLSLALDTRHWADLEAFIRRAFPGSDRMLHFGSPLFRQHPDGPFAFNTGLEYRLKQKTAQAAYRPVGRTRHRRETSSRHDGAPVAPVVGKKMGWTASLDHVARASLTKTKARRRRIREAKDSMPCPPAVEAIDIDR